MLFINFPAKFFPPKKETYRKIGIDAGTWTVQRGRDYGLPSYNDVRVAFGLPRKESFAEITSNAVVQAKLKTLYNETGIFTSQTLRVTYNYLDNIDFFVGILAEDHPGLHMGETMTAAFNNQLMRVFHTDRLFYKVRVIHIYLNHPRIAPNFLLQASTSGFTDEEIAEIDNTKLSDMILRNFPEVPAIQCSAFFSSKTKDCGVVANNTCGVPSNLQETTLLDGNVHIQWELKGNKKTNFVTIKS